MASVKMNDTFGSITERVELIVRCSNCESLDEHGICSKKQKYYSCVTKQECSMPLCPVQCNISKDQLKMCAHLIEDYLKNNESVDWSADVINNNTIAVNRSGNMRFALVFDKGVEDWFIIISGYMLKLDTISKISSLLKQFNFEKGNSEET